MEAEIQSLDQVNEATAEFNKLLREIQDSSRRTSAVRITVEPVQAVDVRRVDRA